MSQGCTATSSIWFIGAEHARGVLVGSIGGFPGIGLLTSFVTYDKRLLDVAQAAACPSTHLPDSTRPTTRATERSGHARYPARCLSHQDITQPRAPARYASSAVRPCSRDPVTSQVTTALGNVSRCQTSPDSPVTSIFANPTRYDLARRSLYPLHGDGQRPNPGISGCSKASSRITTDQRDTSI
jgi:hypothetical protein